MRDFDWLTVCNSPIDWLIVFYTPIDWLFVCYSAIDWLFVCYSPIDWLIVCNSPIDWLIVCYSQNLIGWLFGTYRLIGWRLSCTDSHNGFVLAASHQQQLSIKYLFIIHPLILLIYLTVYPHIFWIFTSPYNQYRNESGPFVSSNQLPQFTSVVMLWARS